MALLMFFPRILELYQLGLVQLALNLVGRDHGSEPWNKFYVFERQLVIDECSRPLFIF
jgi:hypothetical protein